RFQGHMPDSGCRALRPCDSDWQPEGNLPMMEREVARDCEFRFKLDSHSRANWNIALRHELPAM
ncbi:MAG: hypothetical protein L0H75_10275, partial [Nitrosospira sp.]|nr:hypothetical protein [Nitrosospira sp.]